ncbi:MAG: hypothetical protein F4Z86_06160 [Gemmatimonadetes bacterium]|nr:hypothetical protein [Gemmatimonadota bacterium]MYB55930.1 hypothetical protein [Gemmatimonadota bacterium]MYD60791.1 hypothetical protein [Gemmatimonadota bacterium]
MKNPHDELRIYLNKLIYRYRNIKSLDQQLKSIYEWNTPARYEALNLGAHFFWIVDYSLSRIIFLELSMFLSEKEDRSLCDWLNKAKEHVVSINPTRFNKIEREYEPIKPEKYRRIIDCQIAQLQARQNIIDRIKTHRDKAIVHLDREYFYDSQILDTNYPLSADDIDDLIEVVSCILRKHYSCLFQASMSMEVGSVQNIDTVLQYARAWMRARRDSDLIEKGFKPVEYERDEYKQP